jgi:hypothetical protein
MGNLKRRDHSRDPGAEKRKIPKWVFGGIWLNELNWPRIGSGGKTREQGNELHKRRETVD